METAKTKICTVCQVDKAISEFHFHKTHNCYMGKCKECHRAHVRNTYNSMTDEQKKKFSEQKRVYHYEEMLILGKSIKKIKQSRICKN